jgi:hypothetical protein
VFDAKELTTLLGLLKNAPSTVGEAHAFYPTTTKLIGLLGAVRAGKVLMLLDADEAQAVTDGRKPLSEPQPSGPQVPPGALESSQT